MRTSVTQQGDTMKRTDQVSGKPLPVEKGKRECFHTQLHLNICVESAGGTVQKSAKEIIIIIETYLMRTLKDHSFVTLGK